MPIPKPYFLPNRNHACRIETDLTQWGYRTVVLQNELLRITVLADKGADIAEFLYKPLDIDFMWANPTGPRPKSTSYPPADSRQCFGDFYFGGWQELFPHASSPAEVYSARQPQHGEVWGLPWEVRVEEDRPERISVTFSVRTRLSPFVLERTMTLTSGSPVLQIDETAHNLSREKVDVMWGHHPAFGAPFLAGDCVLYAPTKSVRVELKHKTTWPVGINPKGKREDFSKVPARDSRSGRMLYLENMSDGWYALVNPKLKAGFGMRWNHKRFPVVWIWQEANRGRGAPMFGRAYATAIEPFSNLPFARDRKEALLWIPANGKVQTRFLAFAIPDGKPVRSVDKNGRIR
ncbi:MAG: aldose 1-epimerase [Planctomycetes bacterium]|nr:aldose 1-epimerase [Planctomycetota bacterium]